MPGSFKLNLDTERAEIIMPEDIPEDFIEEAMGNYPSSCI
jgi:hypothetical protein